MLCNKRIKNFICMDIIERASSMEEEGKNIIHFEKGEIDFQTPKIITRSAVKAMNDGKTKYTVSTGLQELKEAICDYYLKRYSVKVSPSQVIINAGSSPALLALFLSTFSSDDEIILTDPCYSGYPKFVEISGAKPVYVDIEKNGFEYKAKDIETAITDKTGAIIINSPSNPTGSIIKKEDLRALSKLNKLIISDEVYHRLNYTEERDYTILEFTDNAVVVNSFSKLFAMSGWRLGYIIVPKNFIKRIKPIQQNFFVSPNSFVQWAGITALKEDIPEINETKNQLKKRRDYLEKELIKMGFEIPHSPKGAFYIFANAKKFCPDSVKFAYELLENINVAVAPGVDFGAKGEGYLRFSFTGSMKNIKEGIERLSKYLKDRS